MPHPAAGQTVNGGPHAFVMFAMKKCNVFGDGMPSHLNAVTRNDGVRYFSS